MDDLDRRLLDEFQRDFPLSPTPFADIANRLGVDEATVLASLCALKEMGAVARVGAVIRPGVVGASTLAAVSAPTECLDRIASLISAHPEVNHNYRREHRYNIWFVAVARDGERLTVLMDEIERETGLPVLHLPLVESYCLDLGFRLQWT